jgi:hypothetical protein
MIFRKILLDKKNLGKSLKYFTLQKSKLCEGFIETSLLSFLERSENLKRFSFVLNNEA